MKALKIDITSILYAIIVLLLLFGCKSKPVVTKNMEAFAPYILNYTSGEISKTQKVVVQLQKTPTASDVTKLDPSSFITFYPDAKGSVQIDGNRITFVPEDHFESNELYTAKLDLSKLFTEVENTKETFNFQFKIKEQFVQVDFENLVAVNKNDLSKQKLIGTVTTNDVASNKAIEEMIGAKQNRKKLAIEWSHEPSELKHKFTIKNIIRSGEASDIKLSWNGKSIGAKEKGERQFEIPALGEFKVIEATVKKDEGQFVSVIFSDPLLKNQPLEGLVSISDVTKVTYRYQINNNELRVYPSKAIEGDHELKLFAGIKNSNNDKLPNMNAWTLSFGHSKPAVRLAGKGVIIPDAEQLNFSFEAISLKAVEVEIFKVYANNMLYYLQNNTLEEGWSYNNIGRVIARRHIKLVSDGESAPKVWTKYALDLSEMIKQEPDALYQVRIGFKQEHADCDCEGQESLKVASTDDSLNGWKDANGEIKSFWDNYYGFTGRYRGFNWRHQSNPCFPAYYSSKNFIRRNVYATELAVIAKRGASGNLFIATSNIKTGNKVGGASFIVYDKAMQVLTESKTDSEGTAKVKVDKKPYFITASDGRSKTILNLHDGHSLSVSRFDIAGTKSQKGIKGFLYAERGVWRPGDSIYLNLILNEGDAELPESYPVSLDFYDPKNQKKASFTSLRHVNRIYPLSLKTSTDDPTGDYKAVVKVGGATFTKYLKVETIKPNRLKVDLAFDKEYLSGENMSATLNARWLHGTPASDLNADVEMNLKSVRTTFSKMNDYKFDDPARKFSANAKTVFDKKLDGSGNAWFDIEMPNNKSAPGRLKAHFKSRVFEKGGDFSFDNQTVDFHPYNVYAGINLPKNKWGSNRGAVGKPIEIDVVALNKDGESASNRKLNIGVYKVGWSWWWESTGRNLSNYSSSDHLNAIQKKSLKVNSAGKGSWTFTVPEWGRYLVRVCDDESGHCTGDFMYVGSPRYSGNDNKKKAAAMLDFASDKPNYNVGDAVKLSIPMSEAGMALITLENDKKVVESYWIKAKKGENDFKFYATKEMCPTIYASVSLIQPHGQQNNDLPMRMYGVLPISVENEASHLMPELKIANEIRPGAQFNIEIEEKNDRPMAYTVAIVDEGLLGLTRFKTPDAWAANYAKTALGVQTWDIFDYVVGGQSGNMQRILSIGGDGAVSEIQDANEANRFKPVVLNLGPFYLKKGEKAKHELQMPNYVGAVRAMVVAADGTAFGKAEKTVPVKQAVMTLTTMPRVLSTTSEFSLPVNIFAMDQKVKNTDVRIEVLEGPVEVVGSKVTTVSFDRPGDKTVSFQLKCNDVEGKAIVKIYAEGGGVKSEEEIEVNVNHPNPIETATKDYVIEPGKELVADMDPFGIQGSNEGLLELSTLMPINLQNRLKYLIRYPHGCLEQTISKAFPQLFLSRLVELNEEQANRVQYTMTETINKLKHFQTGSGHFSYWPGRSGINGWGSIYAGHYLLEAQELGHPIPSYLLDGWIQAQQRLANTWDPAQRKHHYHPRSELTQAYRLYVLALAGKPARGAMNRMRETKDISKSALWRLAAAYALDGKPEIAKKIITGLDENIKDYKEFSGTFGSSLRDRAMVLETLVILGEDERAYAVARNVAKSLSGSYWYGTQTTSYALLAIGKFAGKEELTKNLAFEYQLNGGQKVDAGSSKALFEIAVPFESHTSQKVKIKNTGESKIYLRVIQFGKPAIGEEKAKSSGLKMTVNYRDDLGKPLTIKKLKQGQDFTASVSIKNPSSSGMKYEELALTQLFPPGWEIINARFDGAEQPKGDSNAEYTDFRDDRVMRYFDLGAGGTANFSIKLNAAYVGTYYLPPTTCEAMYDNGVYAYSAGELIEVIK